MFCFLKKTWDDDEDNAEHELQQNLTSSRSIRTNMCKMLNICWIPNFHFMVLHNHHRSLLHIRRYTQHHNSKKGKESIAITKVLWYVSESFINPFDFRPHVENETKIKEPSSKIQLTIINTVWQSKHCLKMGFFY